MLLLYTSTHNKHCIARHGSFHAVEKKADEYSFSAKLILQTGSELTS